MSRIFLVSSNTSVDPYPVYPVGMAIIASALTMAGHEVRQFDFLVAEQSVEGLRRAIADFSPDYVGISMRNIDNVDSFSVNEEWYLPGNLAIIKAVRETTGAPVIIGGPAFSVMPEEILQYLAADYGITGEGERALCSLIEALNEGRSAPAIIGNGAVFQSGETMMCRPLWDRDLIGYYVKKSGMISMQTKRGCPHRCTYCRYPAIEGDTIRYRLPDDITDEAERLQKDYGVDMIYFTDSVFNDNDEGYLKIAEALIRKDIKIKWAGFFRPEPIDREKMALLKRSGLYAVEAGTDAASDETLAGINKQFTFDDVYAFNQSCVDAQIPCAHYVMFGGPGETEKTLKEGSRNLEILKDCVVFAFSGIRIFPGAALQTQAIEDGILKRGESLLKPVYYFSPAINPAQMNQVLADAFQGRRDRIFPPSQGLEMARVMNRYGFYGLLWDRLISFHDV
jgi:lipid biosynthesis B12-binding/radical SAM protein